MEAGGNFAKHELDRHHTLAILEAKGCSIQINAPLALGIQASCCSLPVRIQIGIILDRVIQVCGPGARVQSHGVDPIGQIVTQEEPGHRAGGIVLYICEIVLGQSTTIDIF